MTNSNNQDLPPLENLTEAELDEQQKQLYLQQESINLAQAHLYWAQALNKRYKPNANLEIAIAKLESAANLLDPEKPAHHPELQKIYELLANSYQIANQPDKAESTNQLLQQIS